jgi:glycerophosphoryl diester phosphodiesterase
LPNLDTLLHYKKEGIRIIAPPIFALLDVKDKRMVASRYAKDAKAAGLDIISWSLERSGVLAKDKGGWYFQTVQSVIRDEGDVLEAVHVLSHEVGIRGLFSDWPATTTFYANCMDLK